MIPPSLMGPLVQDKQRQRQFVEDYHSSPVSSIPDYVKKNPEVVVEVALLGSGVGNLLRANKMTTAGVQAIRSGRSRSFGIGQSKLTWFDKKTRKGLKEIRKAGRLGLRGKLKISLSGTSYYFDVSDRLGL